MSGRASRSDDSEDESDSYEDYVIRNSGEDKDVRLSHGESGRRDADDSPGREEQSDR